MNYETVLFDVAENGVATITLNRPERLNSFTRKMGSELEHIWRIIREDAAICAIVLRAAGERAFCTGVDVAEGWVDQNAGPFDQRDPSEILCPKPNKVWKPLICAVHGMAAGGAFYWMNDAEIVICSEDATFFDPHVTFGMVSACEPAGMLYRIPIGEIMRIVLMGNDERVSAATALRIGLVSEVVPRDQLWDRAAQIAGIIAAKPAAATQGTVRAVWESLDLPRSIAITNALKYTQLGNRIGTAEVNRATAPKVKWTLR